MPDCSDSTRNAQTIAVLATALPKPLPKGLSRSALDDPLYSIRIAEAPGTLCAVCGEQKTGLGPVGYMDDDPICDLCLLERSTDLGLLLAIVSVVRVYATSSGTPEAHRQALEELGAFSRIFHRIASKSWPARVIRIPGFTGWNDTTH